MSYLNEAAFYRKRNYRLARVLEAGSPPLRRAVAAWVGAASTPPAAWRRGLLIGASHIGDVLCRTGSLSALAAATPRCAWSWAAGRPADQLLETNPHLREVVPLDREAHDMTWAELRALVAGYDVVLCYDLIGYARILAAACAARVPNRIAYAHKGFSWLATLPMPLPAPVPYAWGFRDLVARLGGVPDDPEGRPRIHPTPDDERDAAAAWDRLSLEAGVPVIVCSPFTRQSRGAFPPGLYVDSLRRARGEAAFQCVFVGASGEEGKIEAALSGGGLPYRVLTGLPLRALYCFLRRCRAVFSMDSGIRHVANAASIPVIFARNVLAQPIETGRYCATETDLVPPASGAPRTLEEIARIEPSFDPALAARRLVEAVRRPS